MQVANKIFVVTGAGSGIGRELSLQLLKKGARVAAVDIHPDGLQETKQMAGSDGQIQTFICDVSSLEEVEILIKKIVTRYGSVDGLINNAGIIQPFRRIHELRWEEIEKVMQVNFYGMLYMVRSFLPIILQSREAHIVNVSSMGGFLPIPGQTIYGASKAAVKLFTEGLYSELKGTRVHVTLVLPGGVDTNIRKNSGLILARGKEEKTTAAGGIYAKVKGEIVKGKEMGDNNNYDMLPANRAAEIIIDAIEKNAYRVLVGNDAQFLDRLYRLYPRYATDYVAGKFKNLLAQK